jgi:hypothetical protein
MGQSTFGTSSGSVNNSGNTFSTAYSQAKLLATTASLFVVRSGGLALEVAVSTSLVGVTGTMAALSASTLSASYISLTGTIV